MRRHTMHSRKQRKQWISIHVSLFPLEMFLSCSILSPCSNITVWVPPYPNYKFMYKFISTRHDNRYISFIFFYSNEIQFLLHGVGESGLVWDMFLFEKAHFSLLCVGTLVPNFSERMPQLSSSRHCRFISVGNLISVLMQICDFFTWKVIFVIKIWY